jgi:hypothetical protein
VTVRTSFDIAGDSNDRVQLDAWSPPLSTAREMRSPMLLAPHVFACCHLPADGGVRLTSVLCAYLIDNIPENYKDAYLIGVITSPNRGFGAAFADVRLGCNSM